MNNGFFIKVYQCVRRIPSGRVVTYGDIAKHLGSPKMSRQVGFALHANPEFLAIPCHRVVNRFGCVASGFAFGGAITQRELLEQEGVEFVDDKINLQKYRFDL